MPRKVNQMPDSRDERIVELVDPADIHIVVNAARTLAAQAGFGETDVFMIATAVSELATNAIRYAGTGVATLSVVSIDGRTGVEVVVTDQGPGISDIGLAMTENFSSRKDSLGLGLSSVRRIMDEFDIASEPGRGTRVWARKWS